MCIFESLSHLILKTIETEPDIRTRHVTVECSVWYLYNLLAAEKEKRKTYKLEHPHLLSSWFAPTIIRISFPAEDSKSFTNWRLNASVSNSFHIKDFRNRRKFLKNRIKNRIIRTFINFGT